MSRFGNIVNQLSPVNVANTIATAVIEAAPSNLLPGAKQATAAVFDLITQYTDSLINAGVSGTQAVINATRPTNAGGWGANNVARQIADQMPGGHNGTLGANIVNLPSNVQAAVTHPVSFATGGLIGGTGGVFNIESGGAGIKSNSLRGGLSNQNNRYALIAIAAYMGYSSWAEYAAAQPAAASAAEATVASGGSTEAGIAAATGAGESVTAAGGGLTADAAASTAAMSSETSVLSTILDGAIDGAMKGAASGGLTAGLTGGDVGEGIKRGAVTGAIGGGVGAGLGEVLPSVAIDGSPTLTAAIDSGINQSLTSGAVAAATGQDVGDAMISGALIGAAAPVVNEYLPADTNETLNPTVMGALAGGINAGVTGGSVINGIVVGALGGYGGAVGGIPGAVMGNVIGNEIAPVHTPPQYPVITDPKKPPVYGMSKVGSMIKTDAPADNKPYESTAVKFAKQKRGY